MRIIDAELHPRIPSRAALLPYMDGAWAERFERTAFVLPSGVPHPGHDIHPDDPGRPEAPTTVAPALDGDTDAAILIPAQIMPSAGWCDHAMTAVYATAANRYLLEHALAEDERLHLAVGVSPHVPEAAGAEIRAQAENPRVVAVATSLVNINLGHAHYDPIFAAAQECDLPVVIHPGGTEGVSIGTPTLGGVHPRSAEERYALLPQLPQANIASLIYDGVFTRYPDLRIVFAGFGFAWAVPLLWRADMEWRNLRIDVPWVTEPPSTLAATHIRLTAGELGAAPAETVQQIAGLLPEEVLLYGSDRPFSGASAGEALAGIPEERRARVARENAAATFTRLGAGVQV
jgi:predicted TIM-barrel fold metal-dependent hydrolase